MDDYNDGFVDADDFDYDEYGYMYTEESYDMADELAENAVPDPADFEYLEHEWTDLDAYEYFLDIEYNDDTYYDVNIGASTGTQATKTGGKRKRGLNLEDKTLDKRRKTVSGSHKSSNHEQHQGSDTSLVIWLPVSETFRISSGDETALSAPLPSFALFKDWKERFKDAHGLNIGAVTENPNEDDRSEEAVMVEGDDEEALPEEADEEMSVDIDPELLKTALAAKLSSAGLGSDMNQGAFMEAITQILSGDANASMEDIIGELTTTLLNPDSEGGPGSDVAQWLSNQGVPINEEEEEDEQSINDEKYSASQPTLKRLNLSPGDSAVSTASVDFNQKGTLRPSKNLGNSLTNAGDGSPSRAATDRVMTPRKLSHVLIEKRSISPEKALSQASPIPRKKQKRVSFAVPEDFDRESEDSPEPTTGKSSQGSKHVPMPAEPKKPSQQSRKRKAPVDEAPLPEEKPKRQLRSFATPTASSKGKAAEPTKRSTKSTGQRKQDIENP